MGQSVGISRTCRVKQFQNPTVHAYRSHRKESAYDVSKEKGQDLDLIEAEEQAADAAEEKENEK